MPVQPRADLPSALADSGMIERLLRGRTPAVFLDYDGVLSPIVSHPDLALMSDEMRQVVATLADRRTVAVVSGRDTDDVRSKIRIDGVYYAGSHGFDIIGPDGERVGGDDLARFDGYVASLASAADRVEEAIADIDGAHVERKRFAIAIHFRQAADTAEPDVEAAVRRVAAGHADLRVTTGKKIFEFRPDIDWDKGRALVWLLDAMDLDVDTVAPIYLGDDTTDEDAFRAIEDTGIGIVVGREGPPTMAILALDDTDDVRAFLGELGREATPA